MSCVFVRFIHLFPFFFCRKCIIHKWLNCFLWVWLSLFVFSFSSIFTPQNVLWWRLVLLLTESDFLYTRMYLMQINCPCSVVHESRGWRLLPLPMRYIRESTPQSTQSSDHSYMNWRLLQGRKAKNKEPSLIAVMLLGCLHMHNKQKNISEQHSISLTSSPLHFPGDLPSLAPTPPIVPSTLCISNVMIMATHSR